MYNFFIIFVHNQNKNHTARTFAIPNLFPQSLRWPQVLKPNVIRPMIQIMERHVKKQY